MTFGKVNRLPGFDKDLKRLLKRFPSLDEDLSEFISGQLVLTHKLGLDNRGTFRIPGLGFDEPAVFKAKKFACRSLKGKGAHSGIRVIYAWFSDEDRIDLIEIYFKGEKETEDRERILRVFMDKSSKEVSLLGKK